MMKAVIVVTLGLFLLYALWKAHKNWTRDGIYFLAFNILLFAIVFCVVVLGYRLGGYITFEEVQQAKEDIYAAKADVQEMTKLLIETAYIQMDAAGRLGGTPPEHRAEIQKNAKLLLEKTFKNEDERQEFVEAIEAKIKGLNIQIKKRTRNK